jgi:hypothetical protein
MRHLIAVVLGSLFAVGCVGAVGEEGMGGDDDPNPNPSGKMGQTVYIRDVHPAMAKCSGGACHSTIASSGALGKFYEMDGAAGYTKIVGSPTIIGEGGQAFSSVAPLLTKIQAGHQGVTYTSDETTKITSWLALEVEERKDGSTPTTPTVNPKEVLKTFSGCLTIADFNTAQMAQKWSALAASNNQKCLNCHQAGGDGFIVNANADLMFKVMSENSAYLLKFFSVDTSGTPAKVVVNTGSFMNAGVTIAGHPRFDPTNNAGMVALKAFYDLAAAKQLAGTCSPTPTLKD